MLTGMKVYADRNEMYMLIGVGGMWLIGTKGMHQNAAVTAAAPR